MRNLSIILLLCCSLGCWTSLPAQPAQSRDYKEGFERFKAEKKAFITESAKLTPEEAGKVFPLYDDLQTKKFDLNREVRGAVRTKAGRDKTPTDQECLWAIDELMSIPTKEAKMDKEFYDKLKSILPPSKVLKFRMAEERFARHMMQKMGQRDNERRKK